MARPKVWKEQYHKVYYWPWGGVWAEYSANKPRARGRNILWETIRAKSA